jgi:DNA polymerase III subunit epsilon
MIVCGLDFETTGLDPAVDAVIEIGAVLWDTEAKIPLRMLSELVQTEREISAEITQITGITAQMLDEHGITVETARNRLYELLTFTPYIVAHNGTEFDKQVFDGFWPDGFPLATHWIDTRTDIVFPPRVTTRNLSYLAAEHGFLNPFRHRAVFDVMTMLRVMSEYDITAIITRSSEPIIHVRADVSFADKDKAKQRGFMWSATSRIWWKSMKSSDYTAEVGSYDFYTELMEGRPE